MAGGRERVRSVTIPLYHVPRVPLRDIRYRAAVLRDQRVAHQAYPSDHEHRAPFYDARRC
ncbi:MAG: hypothetical protein H0W11_05385 [Gemmatimonadetes bacterium]|nr:hypothetical protein [Gemmatimonadota bacterium]